MTTLSEAIYATSVDRASEPALFWNDTVLTYGQLRNAALEVSAGLQKQEIRPGDRVAVGFENSPALVHAALGVLYSGATLVPLNPAYTADEVAYILNDCGVRLVLTHPEQAKLISSSTEWKVATDVDAIRCSPLALVQRASEDPALIIYTSGTTGRPKGAILSHRALLTNLSEVARAWEWTASDRLLLTLPCFHLHGLGLGILTSLLVGSSIVLRRRFVVEEVPELLERFACTTFFGVPTMYNRLVLLPDELVRTHDLSRMRLWVSGSAPLTESTFERFRERFGHALMDRYGMTEACFVLSTVLRAERRAGAVGRPLPGIDVRLVDADTADSGLLVDVERGEVGEIVYRGPNLFSGYYGRAKDTEASFVSGYFRSGDMAIIDSDGMFRIVGRRSLDILKSAGFKVSAIEIEGALQKHPEILEVAVVGVPDSDRGEMIVAVVTPCPEANLSSHSVREFARTLLAPHKVPARVEFDADIPRTGPGKFKKRELIARYANTPKTTD